jgi:hypothetical protein
MASVGEMKVVVECSDALSKRFDALESAVAFRPGWITGYANLGRYIGREDKKGRIARAWATEEKLYVKIINGSPSWSLVDVDRAMRNGRTVEVAI